MNKGIFIIAEAGVNHNGSLNTAFKLVDAAKKAKVDAVKFQTFKADNLAGSFAKKANYQKKNMPGSGDSQLRMLKSLELSFPNFRKLKSYCDKKKVLFLSTPFDLESADFLNDLVPLFKVSSGDLNNLPFLKHIAKKNKPVIVSTGMSVLPEVRQAVAVISKNQKCNSKTGFAPLTLLHCTSNYPSLYEEVNLRAIKTLRDIFALPVGYSDHTLGIEVAVAAVALGAEVIEKHFTLDRKMKGPDHKASLEPSELEAMVGAIRNVEKSLGSAVKMPTKSELENKRIVNKSIVAAIDINKGEVFKKENIAVKRPGTGMSPGEWNNVIGRKAKRDFLADELIEL